MKPCHYSFLTLTATVPAFLRIMRQLPEDFLCREIMACSLLQYYWQAKPSLITLLGCCALMCIRLHVSGFVLIRCCMAGTAVAFYCAAPKHQFRGFRRLVFMIQYYHILDLRLNVWFCTSIIKTVTLVCKWFFHPHISDQFMYCMYDDHTCTPSLFAFWWMTLFLII